MNKLRVGGKALLAGAFLGVVSLSSLPYFWNRVIRVVDGDTVILGNIQKVRLLGIDAPEKDRCGGLEAKEYLEKMVLGKKVVLGEVRADSFGRVMALVYLGEKSINREMLLGGFARWDGNRNSESEELKQAAERARENRAGIFGEKCHPVETDREGCLVKANIDKISGQRRYHFPGCREYETTVVEKEAGEGWFCSELEAEAAGYQKATNCYGKSYRPKGK